MHICYQHGLTNFGVIFPTMNQKLAVTTEINQNILNFCNSHEHFINAHPTKEMFVFKNKESKCQIKYQVLRQRYTK